MRSLEKPRHVKGGSPRAHIRGYSEADLPTKVRIRIDRYPDIWHTTTIFSLSVSTR